MRFNNTQHLREYLDRLLEAADDGKLGPGQIRARVAICRTILETIKVEIAASVFGKALDPVSFGATPPPPQKLKRVA